MKEKPKGGKLPVQSQGTRWITHKHSIVYVDALNPPSLLSLSLQEDKIDITTHTESSKWPTNSSQREPKHWPTVNCVIATISSKENGTHEYQSSCLTYFTDSILTNCSAAVLRDLKKLESNVKERLA